MMRKSLLVIAAATASCIAAPAFAQDNASIAAPAHDPNFDQFTPRPDGRNTQLDYSIWSDALNLIVLNMGRSIREVPASLDPNLGTRRTYGHDSRLRLEGNRVGFSMLEPDIVASFTAYRKDLEGLADQIDISKLRRNEQLAFWINLHNVAVIEQIALEYPLSQPSRMKIGAQKLPLDDAKIITVNGVKMSPKDIRTRIVYPNWKDPKVIYGFFRGEIGGPSIQKKAHTAKNMSPLLESSAREFINSLRGTQKRGSTLDVSKIYAEAQPFYFPNWQSDMRTHLDEYAKIEVLDIIEKAEKISPRIYEYDIADFSKGERDPNYGAVASLTPSGDQLPERFRIPRNVQRLLVERQQKEEKFIKRGERRGTVTFIDIDLPGEKEGGDEVD